MVAILTFRLAKHRRVVFSIFLTFKILLCSTVVEIYSNFKISIQKISKSVILQTYEEPLYFI